MSHLVVKSFCHRRAQISQIWLDVPIYDLLVVNVNLKKAMKDIFVMLIGIKKELKISLEPQISVYATTKKKNTDHRVKWITTKNRKKRIRMFKMLERSLKKTKKSRQITPHAMCRHMARATQGHIKVTRRAETKGSDGLDEGGVITEAERERESPRVPPSLPLSTAKSINTFDLSPPLRLSDLILTKSWDQVNNREPVRRYRRPTCSYRGLVKKVPTVFSSS